MSNEDRAILASKRKVHDAACREIRKHLPSFIIVGEQLAVIRDAGIYLDTHKTLEAFVRDEFGIDRRRAYQFIDAAETSSSLCKILHTDDVPKVESQLAEVAKAPKERQAEVVQKVVEQAKQENRKPTATDYRKAVAEVVYEEMPDEPEPAKPATWEPQQMVGPLMSYRKELTQILNKLKKNADERGGEWIDIQALSSAVSNLKSLIQSACYYADCHHCGGTGCTRCKASGFLPHLKHRECDEAIDTEGVMF